MTGRAPTLTTGELYEWLDLPDRVRETYLDWDGTRTRLMDAPLAARMLRRDRWQKAVRDLQALIGDDPDGLIVLWEQLYLACRAWDLYRARGIGRDIFIATMKFSTRYLNEKKRTAGRYAFTASWWFPRELALKEYRLGALEYEYARERQGRFIYLHIPSDADLSPESVDRSFAQFRQFTQTYYPDWQTVGWYCDSWLMSPALFHLLPEDSNILRFSRRFALDTWDPDALGLSWVFPGHKQVGPDLPEDTALQRNMKRWLLKGGKVGWGRAHLIPPDAP